MLLNDLRNIKINSIEGFEVLNVVVFQDTQLIFQIEFEESEEIFNKRHEKGLRNKDYEVLDKKMEKLIKEKAISFSKAVGEDFSWYEFDYPGLLDVCFEIDEDI